VSTQPGAYTDLRVVGRVLNQIEGTADTGEGLLPAMVMRRSRATVRSGRTARALLRRAIHREPFDRKVRTSTRGSRHAPTRPPRHSASPDTLYYRDPTTATILARRRRHNGYYPVVEVAAILFKGFQGRPTTFIFSPMRARSVQHRGPGSWPAAPFSRSRCNICAATMKGENALTLQSMRQRKKSITRPQGEKVEMGRATKKERWAARDGE
jgi:hypothetical protein